jgi:hypothetical protein
MVGNVITEEGTTPLYIIQENKEVLIYTTINNTVNKIIKGRKFQKTDVITAINSRQTTGLFLFKDAQEL